MSTTPGLPKQTFYSINMALMVSGVVPFIQARMVSPKSSGLFVV
jgi:hypothetical protein